MLFARSAPPRPLASRLTDRRGSLRPARPARYSVGRAQPNDEISALDESLATLRSDMNAYSVPDGNAQELANWASLKHALNGLVLRWGQWKTALANDWWWGDDDEISLTTFRNEYNDLRRKVLEYTQARVNAPEIEAPPEIDPAYDPPPPPPTDLTVKELLLWAAGIAVAGGVVYAVAAYRLAPYLAAARRAAGAPA